MYFDTTENFYSIASYIKLIYLIHISPIHISSLGLRSSAFKNLQKPEAACQSPISSIIGAMRSLVCVTLPKQKAPPETYLINDRSVGLVTIPFQIGQTAYLHRRLLFFFRKGNLIPGMSWQGTEDQWLGLQ